MAIFSLDSYPYHVHLSNFVKLSFPFPHTFHSLRALQYSDRGLETCVRCSAGGNSQSEYPRPKRSGSPNSPPSDGGGYNRATVLGGKQNQFLGMF